jgi:hypothetical protein
MYAALSRPACALPMNLTWDFEVTSVLAGKRLWVIGTEKL